jgi:hypothetical protein
VAALRWNRRRTWFLVVWCLTILVLLEFWPLQIFPYTPIHRLPRFLHLAAVPGALLIGVAYHAAMARGRLSRVTAVGLWVVYALHGVGSSLVAVERFQDSQQDLRFAAAISSRFPGQIVTDTELRGYLIFRRGFRDLDKVQKVVGAQVSVPPHSMVIVGGGRRIDMDPEWVQRRVPSDPPPDWVKVADMPGAPRPWRRARGAVYLSDGPSKLQANGAHLVIGPSQCGAGGPWSLVDVIDVGDPNSEEAHDYHIEGQSFFGERTLFSEDGLEIEDDGRAFRGYQAFDLSGLTPGAATCLVKRIDPSARDQVSRWLIGARLAGRMVANPEFTAVWPSSGTQHPGNACRGTASTVQGRIRVRRD